MLHTVTIQDVSISKRRFHTILKKYNGKYDGWDAGQGSFREFYIFNNNNNACAFANEIEKLGGKTTSRCSS